ncbi:STAS domain-containing protein [bacterium]|nr:STAS domain-containing protein [bacterium]
MRLETQEQYNAVVFTPKGKMMGGPDAEKFHEKIKEYLEQDKKNIVVDLGKVNWMNSSGLGILISSLTSVKNAAGNMVIARPTEKINTLLIITQLEKIFTSFETLDDAVNYFKK